MALNHHRPMLVDNLRHHVRKLSLGFGQGPAGEKRRHDGHTSHIGQVSQVHADFQLGFAELDGKTVSRIDVGPAASPVFVSNGDGKDSFFVRINNSTKELSGKEQHEFQGTRWAM